MINMFDFAFAFAAALIGAMLITNHHFRDKINKRIKKSQDGYSTNLAKFTTEELQKFIVKHGDEREPPLDALQEYYKSLYLKQFDGIETITEALSLNNLLNSTILLFLIAIALFLVTGVFPYISIAEYSLLEFCVPSLISGTIAVIFACFGIYKISKKV